MLATAVLVRSPLKRTTFSIIKDSADKTSVGVTTTIQKHYIGFNSRGNATA